MKKNIIIVIAALVFLAGLAIVMTILEPKVGIAVLNSRNNSGQAGTATIINFGGKARVLLTLFGGPADTRQPAHIHDGNCEDLGKIKYALKEVLNGGSETVLAVSVSKVLSSVPLAIAVHKSEQDATFASCGNILAP